MGEMTMEQRVAEHEKRIQDLEKSYGEMKNEMLTVRTSQLEIHNALLTESKEQKSLINKQRQEQDDLLNQLIAHTLGIKKTSQSKRWELALSAIGGGGILYLLIQTTIQLLKQ
ncbi:hypothetical protein [Heyndrickxia acidicola]|uniref:Uncharacterized protein n=1 Tax=Heyndrickxia acidicola TaxID=209389 RepID=A0ABU6MF89_9BACI|nr:hypothetical protein [Heyndrickxia acidicola]MED1201932.1 hypothetical protein [Heyndrickxia acidicola]